VHAENDPAGIRLQKVLAAAGVGSRRQCEQLILEGRVIVDGETVTQLGTRVNPALAKIKVDGQLVRRPKRMLYFLVNKPAGVLSTSHDPSGRPRVIDLAPSDKRLFTVGRLDKSSSGLILVTNDGALTDLLTHPRYGVEKTYLAQVAGVPSTEALKKLEHGVHLAEGYAHAKRVTVKRTHRQSTLLEIVLDEGRNREVRRLLARIGHKVLGLRRVAIGPLRLGNMQPGESRPLQPDEIDELYRAAQTGRKKSAKTHGKSAAMKPAKSLAEEAVSALDMQPIIDESLPADIAENQAALDAGLLAEEHFEPNETASIDLSPLTSGNRQRRTTGTIIGGERHSNQRREKKFNDVSGRRKKNRFGRRRKS
jgi:23S rRNA pseudouridine2605 synthase